METIFSKPLDAQVASNTEAIATLNAIGIKSANVTVSSDANGNASITGVPSAASANGYRNVIRFVLDYTNNKLYYLQPYRIGSSFNWRLWEEYNGAVATSKSASNISGVVYYYG